MSPIHQPGPLNLPARPIRSTMADARHSLTAGVVLLLLGLAVSGALVFGAVPTALGAESAPVRLFKIVTAKDDIVVGLTPDELNALGPGPDIDKIARRLAGAGQITVWQYAVRKAGDGALQQAPLHRIAVFRQDTLRIEPYVAAIPVIPPSGP
jgi:hypothetical protein